MSGVLGITVSEPELAPSHTNTLPLIAHSSIERVGDSNPISGVSLEKQVQIHIQVAILKVADIDTIKEHFTADVYIQARWREQALDQLTDTSSESLGRLWNPNLHVENLTKEIKITKWLEVKKDMSNQLNMVQKIRVFGVFSENMELEEFPFDTQDLTISIMSELSGSNIEFVEDATKLSTVKLRTFCASQEWHLYHHMELSGVCMQRDFSANECIKPGFMVQCRVRRRPGYFISNMFLVTFLITSLSLTSFAVEGDVTHNRLGHSFTILLAAVAFKFVVNQCLPKISYLTYLDTYVLGSMIFLYVIALYHALVGKIHGPPSKYMDTIAFSVLLSLYLIFQIVFIANICRKAIWKNRCMKKKDQLYSVKEVLLHGKIHQKKKSRFWERRHKKSDRLLCELEASRDVSRHIVHIDMDAFYAAVETRDDPSLANIPMAVGGMSMLCTSNYAARKFGVRAAMPGFIAKKLCSHLKIVPLNFDKYRSVSDEVKVIMAEYDPNFCPMSLDEAYLDFTNHLTERRAYGWNDLTYICRNNDKTEHRVKFCTCDANETIRGEILPKIDWKSLQIEEISDDTQVLHEWTIDRDDFGLSDVCTICDEQRPCYKMMTFGRGVEGAVRECRCRIEQKTQLTASAGISCNMLIAKVCSDYNKPNGQFSVQPNRDAILEFVSPLPIRKVGGIGKVSEHMLAALGIQTCRDIYEKRAILYHLYSDMSFHHFMRTCLGLGTTRVARDGERKSKSVEKTFRDTRDPLDLDKILRELCDSLAEELSDEHIMGKTIGLKFKTDKFQLKTKARTVKDHTRDAGVIYNTTRCLLDNEMSLCLPGVLCLRLMGVRMSGLVSDSDTQASSSKRTIVDMLKNAARTTQMKQCEEKENNETAEGCEKKGLFEGYERTCDFDDKSEVHSEISVEENVVATLADTCTQSLGHDRAKGGDAVCDTSEEVNSEIRIEENVVATLADTGTQSSKQHSTKDGNKYYEEVNSEIRVEEKVVGTLAETGSQCSEEHSTTDGDEFLDLDSYTALKEKCRAKVEEIIESNNVETTISPIKQPSIFDTYLRKKLSKYNKNSSEYSDTDSVKSNWSISKLSNDRNNISNENTKDGDEFLERYSALKEKCKAKVEEIIESNNGETTLSPIKQPSIFDTYLRKKLSKYTNNSSDDSDTDSVKSNRSMRKVSNDHNKISNENINSRASDSHESVASTSTSLRLRIETEKCNVKPPDTPQESSDVGMKSEICDANTETNVELNTDDSSQPFMCPVCFLDQTTKNLTEFNQHVDMCLNNYTVKEMVSQENAESDKATRKRNHEDIECKSSQSKRRRSGDTKPRTKPIYSYFTSS